MKKLAIKVLLFFLNRLEMDRNARNEAINKRINEEIGKAKIYSLKEKDNPKFIFTVEDIKTIVKISVEESDKLYGGKVQNESIS